MSISLFLSLVALSAHIPAAIELARSVRAARAEGRPVDWRAVLLFVLKLARPVAEVFAPVVDRLLDQ
jgi:hypothetical protein